MQVKFQNDHVRRTSPRSRKLGKKWRSTGSVFSLPTECLWDCTQYSHNLRQDPCLGPVAAPQGQNFFPALSPSDYKWQKRFHQDKTYNFANSTGMSSPTHRHGRATLECFFPWQPLHSYPQYKDSPSLHHPHPTRETSQRLLLLATIPISTETWLRGASDASFPSSALPTLTHTRVKCSTINPSKNKLVLEQWSFVIYPFLPHISASVVAVPPKEMPTRVTDPRCPHSNESPAFKMTPGPCFDSIYFQNRFGSLLKRLFWSTKWQGEE